MLGLLFGCLVLVYCCPKLTVIHQLPYSQINASMAHDNKYGLEDGIVVRRKDGGFTMISAEMYGDPKWVKMRLGVWNSYGAYNWTKKRTLRTSSANFDGTDPHSSSWGPFLLYDSNIDTWALNYVGYRGAPSNSSGWLSNFQGTIFAQYAQQKGDAGLDSDFGDSRDWRKEDKILLAPDDFKVNGPWPYQCQGLQGTDSFYPFQIDEENWIGFAGTSFQQLPDNHPNTGKWQVSLATSKSMFGPWTRYNPTNQSYPADAPCVDINGGYTENPIVSRYNQGKSFHAVFDVINGESRGFGYSCSEDGFNWEKGVVVEISGGCRTPFGLLPMTQSESIQFKQYSSNPMATLYWFFYTTQEPSFEVFRTAIVQLEL